MRGLDFDSFKSRNVACRKIFHGPLPEVIGSPRDGVCAGLRGLWNEAYVWQPAREWDTEVRTMQEDKAGAGVDLVRWTFSITPEQVKAAEEYLGDQSAEFVVTSDGQVTVTWEEPEGDLDQVIDELWSALGAPVEITHEEFRLVNRLVYESEDEEDGEKKAVA